jgi:hypothetical protein
MGARGIELAAGSSSMTLTVRRRMAIPPAAALREVAQAIAGALLSLSALALGFTTIGVPWATAPMTAAAREVVWFLARHEALLAPLGRRVQEKLPGIIGAALAAAGMGMEMGVFLGGAAIPVIVLMRLDLSTWRIPLFALLRSDA